MGNKCGITKQTVAKKPSKFQDIHIKEIFSQAAALAKTHRTPKWK